MRQFALRCVRVRQFALAYVISICYNATTCDSLRQPDANSDANEIKMRHFLRQTLNKENTVTLQQFNKGDLTKLEFFAAAALTGLLAQQTENWGYNWSGNKGTVQELAAKDAVKYAMALLHALKEAQLPSAIR